VEETGGLIFDGDAGRFRLGIEANRIQVGVQHDMAALAVSNIAPLPHQLEAVYGDFLDQPRLRFLLADDPGAGKTIMAGLYIKELQLRRAADRVLIVTPANLRPQWQRELSERFQIECVQFDRAVFDASPTQNPWDVHDFIIVSRDFMKAESILAAFAAAEETGTSQSSTRPTATPWQQTARGNKQTQWSVQGSREDCGEGPPTNTFDSHPSLWPYGIPLGLVAPS